MPGGAILELAGCGLVMPGTAILALAGYWFVIPRRAMLEYIELAGC